MAFLQYNGVTIDIGKTLMFEMKDVYTRDNTQYLYTHYHLAFQGVINPSLPTTPTGRAGTGPLPTVAIPTPAGTSLPIISPSVTVNQLKSLLKQPRQPLIYATVDLNNAAKTVTLLRSPRQVPGAAAQPNGQPTFFAVDSKNGPLPVGTPDIIENVGDKTFLVRFEIETWLNECDNLHPPGFNVGRVCLAHRWEDSHEIDEDFFTTRTVLGTAIFDAGWLKYLPNIFPAVNAGQPWAPDDFRSTFFHPIQNGFQRRNIQVTATEDGLACNYSFQDEQMPYTLNNTMNIANFQGAYRIGIAMPGGILAAGAQEPGFWSTFLFGRFGNAAAEIIKNALPKRTMELQLTVSGNPTTTRLQLIQAIRRAAAFYGLLPGPNQQGILASSSAQVEINLAKRMASFSQKLSLSRLAQAFAGNATDQALALPAANLDFFNAQLFADSISNFTNVFPGINPAPPGDGGTRGISLQGAVSTVRDALERCVAQALSDTCADPVAANTRTSVLTGTRTTSFSYAATGGA
jgi:hypothetical protein